MLKVPQYVIDAILEVRDSGETNMMDRNTVMVIINRNNDYKAVVWLEDHKKDYGNIIFGAFEIEE